MTVGLRLLLVEDSVDDADLIVRALERAGYRVVVERVEDQAGMQAALAWGAWDLVISDHSLPRFNSDGAIATLRGVDPDVGCLILSGNLGEEAAVQAMRSGADDYLLKDRLSALPTAVERVLGLARARRERHRADSRYRSLVEHAPVGIVTVDTEGLVTSVNPAFEEMSGHSLANSRGQHFRDFVHADDVGAMEAGFAQALRATAPITSEIRVKHRGGLYFYAELTVARLIEAGETTGLFGIFRDISERRSMERELRLSESRLRTLVDSAPDGIYTLSPAGELQSVNPALNALLGYDHSLLGRRFREVLHPDDLPRATDTFARRLRGEIIPPFEIRLIKQDGTAVEVEITSARLEEGGVVAGTLGIVRDMTRRRAYARELAQREERFRLVTLATQDAVYDWDLTRDEIWWNERAATMFGVAPPDGAGFQWWKSQIHPEDQGRVLAGLERAAAERRAHWTDEYRFAHAGGGWRVLIAMGLYQYDERGTPVRMIGAMSDITERRESELEQVRLQEALKGAATDWTVTFDAVPMMVLLVDREGEIRRINRVAREAFGAAWSDVVGKKLGEMPGAPWEIAASIARSAFETETSLMDQVEDDATGRVWNLAAAPFATTEGRQAVVLIRDQTDLVQLQKSLGHQRTMAALGAVVAGVAHEVRNPLFAISATVDALEDRFGKERDFITFAEHLRPEVQRLSTLMRDLLEYGRPPALQKIETDLFPMVRGVIAQTTAVAAPRDVTVTLVAQEAELIVDHDPTRLAQVVQNLLDNALVHAPERSTITVSIRRVEEGELHWCALVVEDEGPGFKPEDLPHVFELFYSKRRGGTGLGLSIVERLVGQHGGRVRAENRPEGGARVTVQLPIR